MNLQKIIIIQHQPLQTEKKRVKYLVGGVLFSGSNEAERTASRKARPERFFSMYQSKKKTGKQIIEQKKKEA